MADSALSCWRDSPLKDKLRHILHNSLHADCQCFVGKDPNQKEFKVHKIFLSMASSVFEVMFLSQLHNNNDCIEITDIQPEIFDMMLNFIYTDSVDLDSAETAFSLYYAADKYMILPLKSQCIKYCNNLLIDKSNVIPVYEFAKFFSIDGLVNDCLEIIETHTKEVINSPSWLNANISTLEMIFGAQYLKASELDLFKGMERWSVAQISMDEMKGEAVIENRREKIKTLLPRIHFLLMSVSDFTTTVLMSSLLTDSEFVAVLKSLVNEDASFLPPGWSTREA